MSIIGNIPPAQGMVEDKVTPAPKAAAAVASSPALAAVNAISTVDVLTQLAAMAAKHDESLNWQTSLVDLFKLLAIDRSPAERRLLAAGLGCPANKMADSAQMNTWLHQRVLQELAANGGSIPPGLLTKY